MKRPGKKVATDRSSSSRFPAAFDVLRAFHPNDGLLGNQEIAARTNLPKPTVSRLTYTLTKLGYLTPVPRFEKYQLAPSKPWRSLCRAGLSAFGIFVRAVPPRTVMRETGGAVAVGGRDRLSMIYFGQSRGQNRGRATGRRFASPDCHHRDGPGLYLCAAGRGACLTVARTARALRQSLARMREGIERAAETVAKHGFAISAGEWHDDIHAVGVALKLNDGTGPYAFNCGAPAFPFHGRSAAQRYWTSLVAMVRNIEAALGGGATQSKKEKPKKLKAGGKVATCWSRGSGSLRRHDRRAHSHGHSGPAGSGGTK